MMIGLCTPAPLAMIGDGNKRMFELRVIVFEHQNAYNFHCLILSIEY